MKSSRTKYPLSKHFVLWIGAIPNSNYQCKLGRSGQNRFFTYSGPKEQPYEIMIQLCNELDKDAWICVKHQDDSNYLPIWPIVLDSLDDHLNIYLEYSNEVGIDLTGSTTMMTTGPEILTMVEPWRKRQERLLPSGMTFLDWSGLPCQRVQFWHPGRFHYLNEQILSTAPQHAWDYGSQPIILDLTTALPAMGWTFWAATLHQLIYWPMPSTPGNGFRPLVKQDYRNIQVFGKEIIILWRWPALCGQLFGNPISYQQAMWDAQNDQVCIIYTIVCTIPIRVGCQLATNFSLASVQEKCIWFMGVLSDIEIQPPYTITAKKYQPYTGQWPNNICKYQNHLAGHWQ